MGGQCPETEKQTPTRTCGAPGGGPQPCAEQEVRLPPLDSRTPGARACESPSSLPRSALPLTPGPGRQVSGRPRARPSQGPPRRFGLDACRQEGPSGCGRGSSLKGAVLSLTTRRASVSRGGPTTNTHPPPTKPHQPRLGPSVTPATPIQSPSAPAAPGSLLPTPSGHLGLLHGKASSPSVISHTSPAPDPKCPHRLLHSTSGGSSSGPCPATWVSCPL